MPDTYRNIFKPTNCRCKDEEFSGPVPVTFLWMGTHAEWKAARPDSPVSTRPRLRVSDHSRVPGRLFRGALRMQSSAAVPPIFILRLYGIIISGMIDGSRLTPDTLIFYFSPLRSASRCLDLRHSLKDAVQELGLLELDWASREQKRRAAVGLVIQCVLVILSEACVYMWTRAHHGASFSF